jgi:hypothetical protein
VWYVDEEERREEFVKGIGCEAFAGVMRDA